nr:dihydroorotase [Propionibacterium sp.]
MPGLFIGGATLADGTRTDLLIRDGVFVDPAAVHRDDERVDAEGLLALPGLVDPHTHLREPGREDAETVATGTLAAARGGFTAVHAMANLSPVTDTRAAAERLQAIARADASAQVVVVGALSRGLAGEELADLDGLHAAGVTMFSDDGRCLMNARLMREAFDLIRTFDGVLAQHCQDHNLAGATACCHECSISHELGLEGWPSVAESSIIARDVELAAYTGARYHACHISTAESVEVIRWAKRRGLPVTAEVMPHHLLLETALVRTGDTVYKVNPPLRTAEHVEAVRAGLADGTIDMVGTDHAPHAAQDKAKPFPEASPGMLGLEQALGVVIQTMVGPGRLTWADVAERMSYAPARLTRLAGQGRPVAVGEPANLVLVDPESARVVDRENTASKSRNNPYDGLLLPDPVVMTVWAGRVTYRR